MIELKFMEALAAVIDQGGFEKASGVLNITQSAVSQRVKQLEDMTGQILLIRSTPPIPTESGSRIIRYFMQVKQLEDELIEEISPSQQNHFTSVSIGINADSLAFWFMDAVIPFLLDEYMTMDIKIDDQDETHRLLKNGEVFGCISSRDITVQGCGSRFLGYMTYRLLATPDFVHKWFPYAESPDRAISTETIMKAPLLVFNRKDRLQHRGLESVLDGPIPDGVPIHYLPSSEKFLTMIASGLAYGMLPDLQSHHLLDNGSLVELIPGIPERVPLFWHSWNIRSGLLERFSNELVKKASGLLEQN